MKYETDNVGMAISGWWGELAEYHDLGDNGYNPGVWRRYSNPGADCTISESTVTYDGGWNNTVYYASGANFDELPTPLGDITLSSDFTTEILCIRTAKNKPIIKDGSSNRKSGEVEVGISMVPDDRVETNKTFSISNEGDYPIEYWFGELDEQPSTNVVVRNSSAREEPTDYEACPVYDIQTHTSIPQASGEDDNFYIIPDEAEFVTEVPTEFPYSKGCIITDEDLNHSHEICFGESPTGLGVGNDYTLAEHLGKILFVELQDGG
jgi:hypothetical protein